MFLEYKQDGNTVREVWELMYFKEPPFIIKKNTDDSQQCPLNSILAKELSLNIYNPFIFAT